MNKVLAILVTIGCTMTNCRPQSPSEVAFNLHMKQVERFWCKRPQLYSIPVTDLLQGNKSPEERFTPLTTVLFRCEATSGCCKENKICAPKTYENVTLIFKVEHIIEKHLADRYKTITAENHTLCHCV